MASESCPTWRQCDYKGLGKSHGLMGGRDGKLIKLSAIASHTVIINADSDSVDLGWCQIFCTLSSTQVTPILVVHE